jgi:hypothetical protein
MTKLTTYPTRNELAQALAAGVSVDAIIAAVNRNNERAALGILARAFDVEVL